MLTYTLRSLLRNPRRALAAIAGVALAIALLADTALFVDGSGRRMTSRAIAHVTIDMQAGINTPLASTLALKATVDPRPPLLAGQPATVSLAVTNTGGQAAQGVVLDARVPAVAGYVPGSTLRDGVPVPDRLPTEDDPGPIDPDPLAAGLPLGVLAPGATSTVTYRVTARQAISSAADLLADATVRSLQDPAPAPANGATAADLPGLAAAIREIHDVQGAQPFALVDLPARSVQVGAQVLDQPVTFVGLDPAYPTDVPIVSFSDGAYAPGTAFVSPALAERIGANPGATVGLTIPGRSPFAPLSVPVAAVADLTKADQLFASREPATLGDYVAAPYVVGIDLATFQQQVLPALRVDAASPAPVLRVPPILEIQVQVAHNALADQPRAAYRATQGVRRSVERVAPGDITVIDNVSASLDRARTDATLAQILFLAIGLPGALLAGYLAFYGGGLLAETERRERALLRARGFGPRSLARGLVVQTVVVGLVGLAVGVGIALGVGALLFPNEFSPHGRGFTISLGIALLVGLLVATFAVYLPARRALLDDVAETRRTLQRSSDPVWLRARLDLVLLAIAVVVTVVFVVTGGSKPSPKAHEESIARSFYILLAPWCLWLGGTLLAARVLLRVSGRLGRPRRAADFRHRLVSKTVLRSATRRPAIVTGGVIVLSLTVAFGMSLAIFVATFRSEQRADARFVVGSDVRVTPGLDQALPPDIMQQLAVPGVDAVSAVTQDSGVVLGTDVVLYAAIDPTTFAQVAPLNPGFFTDTTPGEAMAALAADPNAVIIDKETALDFNVRKGDTIKAQLPSPALGQPVTATFDIVGTVIQFPGFPVGLDLVGNLATYQQETGTTAPSYFLLHTDGSPTTNARVAREVRAALAGAVAVRVDTTAKTANQDQTSVAGLSLTGLGGFEGLYMLAIGALAVVILVAALLMQRSTERATMRALGMERRRLRAVNLGEPLIAAVVSTPVGILLGVPMAYLFVQILRRVFVVPPTHLTVPVSAVLFLGGLLVVTLAVATIMVSTAIRRLRLVELLRTD